MRTRLILKLTLVALLVFVPAATANHLSIRSSRYYFIAKNAAEKFDYNTALINYQRAWDVALTKCDAVFAFAGIKAAKKTLAFKKSRRANNAELGKYFNQTYEDAIFEVPCDLSGEAGPL